ncbi:MAG: hydrolase TatD, partial [Bacteroidales bacterium]
MPLPFIDTHTHIYTDDFDADRAEVVGRALEAGAQKLFLPNIDAASVESRGRELPPNPRPSENQIGRHPPGQTPPPPP